MTTFRWVTAAALLALPLLPACYSDLKKKNSDLANQNRQLETELNQTKAERDEARAREEILNKQVASARDEARTAREVSAVRSPSGEEPHGEPVGAKASKSAPSSAAEAAAMTRKLSGALAHSKAHVQTKDGKVCVTLPGLSFEAGSADLDASDKKLVREVAKAIQKDLDSDSRLLVVGHTDSDPPKKSKAKYPDNKALSFARAQSVVAELRAAGIEGKRMVASGAGDTQPVAAGNSPKEKEKNRRVEIWID